MARSLRILGSDKTQQASLDTTEAVELSRYPFLAKEGIPILPAPPVRTWISSLYFKFVVTATLHLSQGGNLERPLLPLETIYKHTE